MKVEVCVNLGNFEHLKITSSEYDDIETCFAEVSDALSRIKHYEAQMFKENYLDTREYKGIRGAFQT